jgi:hypothetical protein
VIPQSKEKYISFTIDHLRFIDSLQFMDSSLEILTENLKKTGLKSFTHSAKHLSKELLDLMTRKGVCPYDYVNDFSKFDEASLPAKHQFYSILNDSHITNSDYQHAQNVWIKGKCNSLRDYLRLYLKSDVLTLVDVFESFRNFCMKHYGLDCLHYYGAPSLAWDALFKVTRHQQELLTDPDMYLFCEQGIRGGISMISNIYSKANNKYMSNYDSSQPSKYIAYWDVNA